MNFYQRQKGNRTWIKNNGCLVISIIYHAYRFYRFDNKININLNEWYEIFKNNNLFTKNDKLIWNRISRVFPYIKAKTHLWSGKHKDIDLIDTHSIISVDYKQDPKYKNSHFMPVIDVFENSIDDIFVYNPYYDLRELVSNRYLINDSLKDSVFSIINLKFRNS